MAENLSFAYAVVHNDQGDTPDVYAAEDVDTLHRVLALKVVATTSAATLSTGRAEELRRSLMEEQWGDAVVGWMEATGQIVDVYPDGLQIWTTERFAEHELVGLELRLMPLFADGDS